MNKPPFICLFRQGQSLWVLPFGAALSAAAVNTPVRASWRMSAASPSLDLLAHEDRGPSQALFPFLPRPACFP